MELGTILRSTHRGGLGKEFKKGSEAHKNSVTGDTVGDPLKNTSGPVLHFVMMLTAIISLVFGSAIADFSNASGGPFVRCGVPSTCLRLPVNCRSVRRRGKALVRCPPRDA